MTPHEPPCPAPQTVAKPDSSAIALSERAAYSPAEFAGLFGRGKTWAYRQLYAGRVKAITSIGQLMIPRSEAERLLALATTFNGDPKRAPKARKKAPEADTH